MFDRDLAQEIAKTALGSGGAYSDVIFQRRTVTNVRFEDGRVDDISVGLELGAGVRAISGDLAAYAHTDVIDRDSLLAAARAAAEALAHSTAERPLTVAVSPRPVPPAVCDPGEAAHDLAVVTGHLAACDEAARGLAGEVRQVTAQHAGLLEEELFVDSLGEVRERSCRRTRLIVQVVAARDGEMQVGMEAPGALTGPEFYEHTDGPAVALVAARRAMVMLDARPSPAGRMAVVINQGTGGVLLHEACGHGLEVDHVHKGASVYGGKIGSKVANEIVNAVDDPSLPGLWGSYLWDDEGVPSAETFLIEDGVLRGFLYDRHEAMKDGAQSTGNGRRQSFRFPPIPRMSNTYIKPGAADPTEILSSTPRGLYAAKMGGGQVDPVTGDYVFSVSEGYLIEGGRLGPAVRGAMLIGNGPRTLELIDAVGSDLDYDEGTCGKDGQGVPVTTGGPTFRIAELTVGGTDV